MQNLCVCVYSCLSINVFFLFFFESGCPLSVSICLCTCFLLSNKERCFEKEIMTITEEFISVNGRVVILWSGRDKEAHSLISIKMIAFRETWWSGRKWAHLMMRM